eukprot:scpid25239/ scgid6324/ Centrosomal protein of 112 kDa; Coiled-coil domain-containing protein 46
MATFATRQVHQSGGSDFETVVSRVKPLVKRLMKSDRQLAVQWLRRLREELAVSETQRPLCQSYVERLSQDVQAGYLTEPFNSPPPSGHLTALQPQGVPDSDDSLNDSLGALEDGSYIHGTASYPASTSSQRVTATNGLFRPSGYGDMMQRDSRVTHDLHAASTRILPSPSSLKDPLGASHRLPSATSAAITAPHLPSSGLFALPSSSSHGGMPSPSHMSTHSQSSLEAFHRTLRTQQPVSTRNQSTAVSGQVSSMPTTNVYSLNISSAGGRFREGLTSHLTQYQPGAELPGKSSSLTSLSSVCTADSRRKATLPARSSIVSDSLGSDHFSLSSPSTAARRGHQSVTTTHLPGTLPHQATVPSSVPHAANGHPRTASAVVDAELASSEDESLERLLAGAQPPGDADGSLSSVLDDSDSDSVANLLTSAPPPRHMPASPMRSVTLTSSRGSSTAMHSVTTSAKPTVNSTRFASLDSKPAHTTSAQSSSTSGITATVRNDSVFSSGAPAAASPPVHHRRSGTQADVNSLLHTTQLELEKLRVVHRAHTTQAEMTSSQLHDQVRQLEQELAAVKQEASTSMDRLRAKSRSRVKSVEEKWQQKMNDVIASCESDKLALQQHQTSGMQQLLEETEQRLRKVEEEHKEQAMAMTATISSLEGKVAQLSDESEQANVRYVKLLQERTALSTQLQSKQAQCDELTGRCRTLEQQQFSTKESQQAVLEELRQQMDENLLNTRHEAGQAQEQLQEHIHRLQQDLALTKDLLGTAQHQHSLQVQELTNESKTSQERLQSKHELELHSLKSELEQRLSDTRTQLHTAQSIITDKEEKVRDLQAECTATQEDARRSLDTFKQSIESTTAKANEEITKQMATIKNDLEQSKSARQQQAKEFRRQNELQKQQHEAEIMKLQAGFEREKASLIEDHQQQFSTQLQERDRERESSLARLRAAIAESESKMKLQSENDFAVIRDLEEQLQQARSEITQTIAQCNSQLLELKHRNAGEQERCNREMENTANRLRSEVSHLRAKLQQEHSAEIDELLAKTNNRLQLLEADYTGKVASISKSNQKLQKELRQAKSELDNERARHEREEDSRDNRHSEMVAALHQQHDTALQTLQQEVDLQRNRVHHLEKKIRHRSLQEEEKIAKLTQQFEDKVRGLLPTSVRQDLEDTITSLKKQVETLEQHTSLLQRQLNSRRDPYRTPPLATAAAAAVA